MAKWKWARFASKSGAPDTFKPHAFPATLERSLLRDLIDRDAAVSSVEPCTSLFADEPGIINVRRPIRHYDVGGLVLQIPSEDVDVFQHRLAEAPARTFEPLPRSHVHRSYFKLHTWRLCLVLTVAQKNNLARQLLADLQFAVADARAFYSQNKLPTTVLREVQEARAGRPLPELARHPDRNLRHARDRGKA